MPSRRLAALLLLGALGVDGCASVTRSPRSLESEAREFMATYARDLRGGNRAALAARYDRRGAYIAGQGEQRLMAPDSISAMYHGAGWTAPARFEWRDLAYEVVGPDAVLVSGRFEWTTAAGETLPASYTTLLVRRDGALRIRAEHEDVAPRALRKQICGA